MIVNNPDNAGLTPGLGISLVILSNNFSALTAVSFVAERLVGAVSKRGGTEFVVWAFIEVEMSYSLSEAVSVAAASARGGFGVGVLQGCCWTRPRFDCDPGDLCFPRFLSFEENFEDMNLRMMIQNRFELDNEAST